MPKKAFETRQERETFLKSLVQREVAIIRETSGPDDYTFVVSNGDGTLTTMSVTIRRTVEWPSNVKLGGRKQIL